MFGAHYGDTFLDCHLYQNDGTFLLLQLAGGILSVSSVFWVVLCEDSMVVRAVQLSAKRY